jgi:monoamine oxidase
VLEQLSALFGPEASDPEELFVHDWRRERHTSPPGVEELTSFGTYGHPVYATPAWDGLLHWASTETAREYAGHVEGALSSGARAASAILSRLRRLAG